MLGLGALALAYMDCHLVPARLTQWFL